MDHLRRASPLPGSSAFFPSSSTSASTGSSTCCNSDAGGLEEQRSYDISSSPGSSSYGVASPPATDEEQGAEKGQCYHEWAASRRHKRKISDMPRLLSQRLQQHLPAGAGRVTPSRMRLVLKVLAVLTGLLVLSAMLPATSPLSVWYRGDSLRLAGETARYDWRNERMASGKGWGWGLAEGMRDTTPPSAANPHSNTHASLGYEEAATRPPLDIPCQLDASAFASRYRLTPKFKYSRRYVTAAPRPPAPDKPSGFDPHPRELSAPIVEGWETMAWHGVPIDEACRGKEGDKMGACIAKEQRMRVSRGALDTTSASTSASSPQGLTRLSSCSSSLEPLRIPTYPIPRTQTQPEHVILGLASDADRLLEMMPILAYSFAHSNLHLVLNLPKNSRIPELRKTLRARSIRATIILSPEEDYLRRWVELPSLLLDFADPGLTRWAMVADDDTVFLSMPKLFKALDRYDHTESHYIGALTDDWRQAGSGMIAYGGAGVVLSMPLLHELSPHWSSCRQLEKAGDYRLAACIYAHTHTRLTIEWGLHQTDLYDDIRGMLESGRDIITWHHWKSWNTGLDPILLSRAGAACGSECLLQRFLSNAASSGPNNATTPASTQSEVAGGDISSSSKRASLAYHFVHGLSLTLHPTPLPDFARTEMTWKIWANSDFSQSVGPTRPRIREGRPPLSRFHDSDGTGTGTGPRAWKETWLLEDVREGEELGKGDSWDDDGRGIREIYIKRAGRARGYVTAGVYDGEGASDEEDEGLDVVSAEARRHRELKGSLRGLVDRLLGNSMSEEERGRIVEEEIADEEQDSVVELVWV
ncbi:hypothetical protein BDZ90DRAFT_65630 [Jaminaea rosea]|uniref:Fringe-like glycosyltransferase domain-containing protein n=1 Tax=Jaminaea rosea TaxID=1569628 RepID=A0A316UKY6_9BASI|nr:hypothetical protein BDZ90DRAFT_65630 [Jaminaea rosea]PWN25899.1 hypothetical protein BDZ90DRAFT_65630 [Jaminaea rosea]